jgi:small subunit ribosomal protein S8
MDPISNMLTAIKNALASKKEEIFIPVSKLKIEILKILKKEGFIENYEIVESRLKIKLKYKGKEPAIVEIKRVSKPGCRIYLKNQEIPQVLGGLGIVILSTTAGVMTGKEAKKKGLGGEVICKVW